MINAYHYQSRDRTRFFFFQDRTTHYARTPAPGSCKHYNSLGFHHDQCSVSVVVRLPDNVHVYLYVCVIDQVPGQYMPERRSRDRGGKYRPHSIEYRTVLPACTCAVNTFITRARLGYSATGYQHFFFHFFL